MIWFLYGLSAGVSRNGAEFSAGEDSDSSGVQKRASRRGPVPAKLAARTKGRAASS